MGHRRSWSASASLVGLGIAYVREKTGLASDTVIGVFFAGAIGLAAMLLQGSCRSRQLLQPRRTSCSAIRSRSRRDDLVFLFLPRRRHGGVPGLDVQPPGLHQLQPQPGPLAAHPVRLCNYVFIVLLALIVNVCLKTVGVLLINALLIVPAATAANLCRNMRQLFWRTIVLCLVISCFGLWLSSQVRLPDPTIRATRSSSASAAPWWCSPCCCSSCR